MIGADATTLVRKAKDGEDKLAIGGVAGEGGRLKSPDARSLALCTA